MEMEKDTGLTSVKIEWIYLKKGKIKRYYFERLKGLWKLEAIDFADMPREDTGKEDFFEFYERFRYWKRLWRPGNGSHSSLYCLVRI